MNIEKYSADVVTMDAAVEYYYITFKQNEKPMDYLKKK